MTHENMASGEEHISASFRIELSPPLRPSQYAAYYNRFKHLLEHTNKFALTSHESNSISGFDRNYNFYKYLLGLNCKLDVLFHLTCRDLNKVNVESRVQLLKLVNIRNILVISGEGYEMPLNGYDELHFKNSLELTQYLDEKHSNWFGQMIAVAGYPGVVSAWGSLVDKTKLESVNTIYTQCCFSHHDYTTFFEDVIDERRLKVKRIVPSVAIFQDHGTLLKCSRILRVGTNDSKLRQLLRSESLDKGTSCDFLTDMIVRVICFHKNHVWINICAFGNFEQTADVIKAVNSRMGSVQSTDYWTQ